MKSLLILVCLFPVFCQGQIIDNTKCNALSDEPFFYKPFIAENKIKSISGTISTKKNLQVIEQKGMMTRFEFDTNGNFIKQYGSFSRVGVKDTTIINYKYDKENHLITQQTNDSYGFYSYNFTYNPAGDVIEKTYCRDENAGKDRYNFVLKKQYVIVKEGYSYEKTDSTVTRNILNNHGRVYQKETSFYNDLGLLDRTVKKLIVNHKKSITTYQYNDLGLVSEKKVQPDVKIENYQITSFEYDEFGNLEYIDEIRNGKKVTHNEIIYDKSTYLIKALLIQDVETNFIKIIKFKYDFYE